MSELVHRLQPAASRATALGLLAIVLWVAADWIVGPAVERYRAVDAEIEAVRMQMGRVEAILKSGGDVPVAGDFSGQSWEGQSRSIVAARLQEFVQARARDNGVAVISISPLQQRPFERFETIGLRVEAEGEIGAIRDLIAQIENARPFVFIVGTDLRKQQIFGERQPGQRLPLAARLDLFAPVSVEETP